MPINASYEFFEAEKKYLAAGSLEEKIKCLEELIRKAPKHKSSENLLAELKTRLKKLLGQLDKSKKTGKGKKGIRKEGYQVAVVGFANAGKSCLLGKLTNAKPFISEVEFSTKGVEIGTMDYGGVKAQIVDLPAFKGKDFDYGIVNNADCLLIVLDAWDFGSVVKLKGFLEKVVGKKIYIFNKIDLLSVNEVRKLDARCRSKKLDYVLVSCLSGQGVGDLKERIFEKMDVVRIYTKEPGQVANKDPVVLRKGATVKEVAETIYKGFSLKVKETRLTGPSGKFSNQKVGLKPVLKDKDIVEFHSK